MSNFLSFFPSFDSLRFQFRSAWAQWLPESESSTKLHKFSQLLDNNYWSTGTPAVWRQTYICIQQKRRLTEVKVSGRAIVETSGGEVGPCSKSCKTGERCKLFQSSWMSNSDVLRGGVGSFFDTLHVFDTA